MEIILWFIGIVLGILLLRFLFTFIIQLIGLGIYLAILSVVVCGVLAFFEVMECPRNRTALQYRFLYFQ